VYPTVFVPPPKLAYTGVNVVLEIVVAAVLILGGLVALRLGSARRSKRAKRTKISAK